MDSFQYKNQQLYVEDIKLSDLAKKIGTPFYCYSANYLRQQYQNFSQGFKGSDCLIAYALKANSNLAVLNLLQQEGAGADVVSKGELYRALKANINPSKIVYSGVGKTIDEMDFALSRNILCFNVESEAEILQLNERARSFGRIAPISLRVNPNVDAKTHKKIATGKSENKFGIPLSQARQIYHQITQLKNLKICGVDVHIGSQINDLEPFSEALSLICHLVQDLRHDGHNIAHVDVGGGLGVYYNNTNKMPPIAQDYASLVRQKLDNLNVKIICEPGRYISANAGFLVVSVIYLKRGEGKNFIVVDGAMNDLIRPTLYDAFHQVLPAQQTCNSQNITADIVGPICETGDYLALDRVMPVPAAGDILAVASSGAYGAVMSNTYNSRLLVPEVLIENSSYALIRRRPTYDELFALETQYPKFSKL